MPTLKSRLNTTRLHRVGDNARPPNWHTPGESTTPCAVRTNS